MEGDKQARSVLSIHRIHEHSACLAQLLFHPNLVDPAAAVIGPPNVQRHHTLMHSKPSKIGAAFPMHQDYDYFPHKLDAMIAATLYLDDADTKKTVVYASIRAVTKGDTSNSMCIRAHIIC